MPSPHKDWDYRWTLPHLADFGFVPTIYVLVSYCYDKHHNQKHLEERVYLAYMSEHDMREVQAGTHHEGQEPESKN